MSKIHSEITNLNPEDLFLLANHKPAKFDYPIHFHSDYEINLVMNISGKRIIGDSMENFNNDDLVLIGSNLPHAWKAPFDKDNHIINIKFQAQILDSWILDKRLFLPVKEMLERASRGILFSQETIVDMKGKFLKLSQSQGFSSALDFLSILYDLATSQKQRVLASTNYSSLSIVKTSQSRRINTICQYINQNYHREITLKEIGDLVNMSESAISHFFKKRTGRSFITYINDVRIGNASRLLEETTRSISDVAYSCGFNNLSNFNHTFKKYRNQTPRVYRNDIQNTVTKY
ncbi:MAG: AraC family transcriptional regulator [Bacteroidales bacterium]|jgi:AraC-like DNA-binding protein